MMSHSVLVGGVGAVALGAIGFFVGRAKVDTGPVAQEDSKESRYMRVHEGRGASRDSSGSGWREKYGNDPRLATRRVLAQLSHSPMLNMDFDSLFPVWDLFRTMSLEEIKLAMEEVEESRNPQLAMMMRMMVMNRWAALDGLGAMEHALGKKGEGMQGMMTVNGALMGWMKHDPEGAYAWYEENRDQFGGGMMGAQQMDMLFYSNMAQSDLPGALDKVLSLDNKRVRDQAIAAIAGQMTMDPDKREEFFALLDEVEDQALAKNAKRSMMNAWGWQDPKAAVEYLEQATLTPEERKELEQNLVSTWVNTNPSEALQWKLSRAEGLKEQQEAVESTFGDWIRRDERGASEWLSNQPEELMTDDLFKNAAENLRWNESFERSVAWAEQIVDDQSRTNQLQQVYSHWKGSDEQAAQEWLATLDEDTQAQVLQGADQLGPTPVPTTKETSGAVREAIVRQLEALDQEIEGAEEEVAARRQALEAVLEDIEQQEEE